MKIKLGVLLGDEGSIGRGIPRWGGGWFRKRS